MGEYIDKSYLFKVLSSFNEIVESAPVADVVPMRYGEWLENENFDDGFWTCSACGFVSEADAAPYLYRYCPYCGAKMEAEE